MVFTGSGLRYVNMHINVCVGMFLCIFLHFCWSVLLCLSVCESMCSLCTQRDDRLTSVNGHHCLSHSIPSCFVSLPFSFAIGIQLLMLYTVFHSWIGFHILLQEHSVHVSIKNYSTCVGTCKKIPIVTRKLNFFLLCTVVCLAACLPSWCLIILY